MIHTSYLHGFLKKIWNNLVCLNGFTAGSAQNVDNKYKKLTKKLYRFVAGYKHVKNSDKK